MVPTAGGYEAFLSSTVLALEFRLTEALKNLAEVVFTRPTNNEPINSRMEEAEVETAYKVNICLFSCQNIVNKLVVSCH